MGNFSEKGEVQKEGIQQNFQITMTCDHPLQDEPRDRLPPRPSARPTLLPLLPELAQLRIADPLLTGNEDRVRRLPQSLSASILELQV